MNFNMTDTLKNSINESLNMQQEEIISEDSFYFQRCLETITALREEYDNNTIELYKALNESSNKNDVENIYKVFYNKSKEIIEKFIVFIDSSYDRFYKSFLSKIRSDKSFKKYEGFFLDYKSTDIYEDRYIYSNLDNIKIPKYEALTSYQKEYDNIKKLFAGYETSVEKVKNITDAYNAFINELYNGYYDIIRGKMVDKDYVLCEDYSKELFNVFRSSGIINSNPINGVEIKAIYERMDSYKSIMDELKKQKLNIKLEYKSIQSNLSSLDFSAYYGGLGDNVDEIILKYNSYMKAKLDQLFKISTIHYQAFTAKLDAISDAYMQDRKILNAALLNISKEGGNIND